MTRAQQLSKVAYECDASAGNGEGIPPFKIAERTYEEGTKALQRGRESGHSEAASFGEGASLRSVRAIGPPAYGVLPLAEGVLRERGGGLSGAATSAPPGGGEAEAD